jgi:hypothetical protein
MGLKDEVVALRSVRGPQCRMCRLLTASSALERAEIEDALQDPELEGFALARALTARGHTISGQTLNRHRRGLCESR